MPTSSELPEELILMRQQIETLPFNQRQRDQLLLMLDTLTYHIRLKDRLLRTIRGVKEQLELDIKYLAFDLDATRRERDELQHVLDELRQKFGGEPDE